MNLTRRIIAVMAVAVALPVFSYLALKGSDAAFTVLVGLVSTIIGYYYGTAGKAN